MKLGQETDWRNTTITRSRNFVDWSGHDAAITDADQRSQLHRRGNQLLAEGRRNNSDREPREEHKRKGRSIAMDRGKCGKACKISSGRIYYSTFSGYLT